MTPNPIHSDKFFNWSNREIDLHLCGLESYMVHHELTKEELDEILEAIDSANREILNRVHSGWDVVNLTDILRKYKREED